MIVPPPYVQIVLLASHQLMTADVIVAEEAHMELEVNQPVSLAQQAHTHLQLPRHVTHVQEARILGQELLVAALVSLASTQTQPQDLQAVLLVLLEPTQRPQYHLEPDVLIALPANLRLLGQLLAQRARLANIQSLVQRPARIVSLERGQTLEMGPVPLVQAVHFQLLGLQVVQPAQQALMRPQDRQDALNVQQERGYLSQRALVIHVQRGHIRQQLVQLTLLHVCLVEMVNILLQGPRNAAYVKPALFRLEAQEVARIAQQDNILAQELGPV